MLFTAMFLSLCITLSEPDSGAPPVTVSTQTYPMQALAPTAAAILDVPAPKDAEAPAIEKVVKDLQGAKKVAIIGIDAFGEEVWNRLYEKTPYLNSITTKSNRARLRSVLPSATPMNFGCMITGVSQKTSGIKSFDSKIKCDDICSVLRKRGMKSGGFGIKDYTGDRLLGRYADFSTPNMRSDLEVLAGLKKVVEKEKPEFIIVQYGVTDDVFHRHGPFSKQAGEECARADAWMKKLIPWLQSRGYAILITADHGQHEYTRKDGTIGGTHGSAEDIDCIVPLVWLAPNVYKN